MGFLDIFKRNSELDWMYDLELLDDVSERTHYKRLAIQTCTNMIARTISQSEFRFKEDQRTIKDRKYYKFNVRPNVNTSASMFWHTVVHKLVYENECLIIKNDTDELLIADQYERLQNANYQDRFKGVTVKDFTFQRTFFSEDVIFLEYANDNLIKLIDSLYSDYGELIGRMFELEKRKGQIRATVDIDQVSGKDEEKTGRLQKYIDRIYSAVREKSIAIVPQQKGFTYNEHAKGGESPSVKEINDVTNGFLDQVARALGIPPSFARGDMSDVENGAKNFMTFCIDPLLKKLTDELNAKLFSEKEYLDGHRLDIRRISYRDAFDMASAVDKLRSSGVMNGHELRDKLGLEHSDDPSLEKFMITKNFAPGADASEGGEEE